MKELKKLALILRALGITANVVRNKLHVMMKLLVTILFASV